MFTVLLNSIISFIAAMQLRLPNQIIFIVHDKENFCNFLAANNNIYDNFIIDAFT